VLKFLSLHLKALIILSAIILLQHQESFGQERTKIDSLTMELKSAKSDSVKVYLNVAISKLFVTTDLTKALNYAENAVVDLAEKSENSMMHSDALLNLGNVFFSQGLFELALKQYYHYLEIQKQEDNKKGIATALINMGAISLNMSDFKKALGNFKEALKIFEELRGKSDSTKYKAEIITCYNNLGIACQNLKEQKASADYYLKGIALARKELGNSTLLANLLNNLGSLYLDQQKLDEAYLVADEALKIRLLIFDKNGQAQSYRSLALYYLGKGKQKKAMEYLYLGFDLAQKVGNISLQSFLVNRLFEEYNKAGRADSALKYQILYRELEDKMNNEETQRELTQIELKLQFNEREKLRELETKRKEFQYLMIGISLVLSLAIISLLFLLSQNRLKRLRLEKTNMNLASKNLELEKSALKQELELKNKELTINVMYLLQKNEYLTDITERVIELKKDQPDDQGNRIDKLIHDLQNNSDDNLWKEFEKRFQEVHQDFYSRLNARFPDLTPNEKKLAAFLRLNMTTKDISAITFQLPDSIKTARSRLRKKLGLPQEANIISFLENI
jgi:tetratricopeptide (TPR) repeat protein